MEMFLAALLAVYTFLSLFAGLGIQMDIGQQKGVLRCLKLVKKSSIISSQFKTNGIFIIVWDGCQNGPLYRPLFLKHIVYLSLKIYFVSTKSAAWDPY